MNIYKINLKHLEEAHKIDNKVMIKENRPYIGVVLDINSYKYFAPLTSVQESRAKLNSQATVKIISKKTNEFLGAIRFNNMIPCNESDYNKVNISQIKDFKYKSLIQKQYEVIIYELYDKIIEKSKKIYYLKTNKPQNFVLKLCCDFKKLEDNIIQSKS